MQPAFQLCCRWSMCLAEVVCLPLGQGTAAAACYSDCADAVRPLIGQNTEISRKNQARSNRVEIS